MSGKQRRSGAIGSRRAQSLGLLSGMFWGMLLAALLPGLTGCGKFFVPQNNTPTNNSGDYLYIGNGGNAFITGFSVSSSGTLAAVPNSPYNNGIAALALAITPNNSFLYAGTTNGIYAYAINSDGSLTIQNSGNPVAQDVIVTAMQVDSTGAFLLAAGLGAAAQAQAIGIYQIGSAGALTALGGSPLTLYTGSTTSPTVLTPTGMLITPSNSLVYVSLGTLGVQLLTLGSNGVLSTGNTPTVYFPSTKSSNPADFGLASDPNSKFLFVCEINTGLRAFSIGTNGVLNEISGSPYTVGTGPAGVIVDPTGAYIYLANKGSNNISAFSLNASSGQLTAISGSPFASGGQLPTALVSDNSKKYLAVINSGSNGSSGNNDLQLFSYASAGGLTAGATAATGTDPSNPQTIAATYPASN